MVKTLCVLGGTWAIYRILCQNKKENRLRDYEKAIANFPRLSLTDSLVAKYLTPEIYAKLFSRRTSNGTRIDQILQTQSVGE